MREESYKIRCIDINITDKVFVQLYPDFKSSGIYKHATSNPNFPTSKLMFNIPTEQLIGLTIPQIQLKIKKLLLFI
jgi:hypothetical protein